MVPPSTENLKARLPKDNTNKDQRLENMKSNLRLAYRLAAKANRKSHLNDKRLYDRKAKPREFEVQDLVYLYNPALKPGLTRTVDKSLSDYQEKFRTELWNSGFKGQTSSCAQ